MQVGKVLKEVDWACAAWNMELIAAEGDDADEQKAAASNISNKKHQSFL